MTGDKDRGNAVADKWRETFEKHRRDSDLSLTRLDVRAEQQSANFEEDSVIIQTEAGRRVDARMGSDPPKVAKGIVYVLNAVKTPAQVVALAILVAALAGLVLSGWKR